MKNISLIPFYSIYNIYWSIFITILEGASQEKTRLEEKQRESRNKNGKYEYKGKWFQVSKHPVCNEEAWLFNNKYWLRNYSDCLNLY